jgi:hypothetical protein
LSAGFWQDRDMSLDKPPPSRYRIEEKNGQLIVHDSMARIQAPSTTPEAQPRSALDTVGRAQPAAPNPVGLPTVDSGKAKRGGTVAVIAIFLALFLIITSLWPMMVLAMVIAPIRKQLLGNVLPAVKRYINEGRIS